MGINDELHDMIETADAAAPKVENPTWYQLYVRAPEGNGYTTPQAMKRVDETISMFGAMMRVPKDLPEQESDGTWEVRVLNPSVLSIVKNMLQREFGLEVIKEVPQA